SNVVFLRTTTSGLLSNDAAGQNFESACLALLFALMNFSTPFVINMIMPISRTSHFGQYILAISSGKMSAIAGAGEKAIGAGVGAAVGGPGGAAAGASAGGGAADSTQKIVGSGGSPGESGGAEGAAA
ncbi:MAG: hypothetical protein ACREAC_16125, partial [Blastocatellia bacterium]